MKTDVKNETGSIANNLLSNPSLIAKSKKEITSDWRHIANGFEIPTISYSDQPYIIKTNDGAWLCAITTGSGHEGTPGQHIITLRSFDKGRTWIDTVAVEPVDGPEASYAVLFKTAYGRVYIFYNHNTDNLRQVIADNPPYKSGFCTRVDSLGHYVFKYSDDHGKTWSDMRYEIPIRVMDIDLTNPYKGRLRFFWNVGKPFEFQNIMYLPHHKVGRIGAGFFVSSEGVLLKSENITYEKEPKKIKWKTLPEGEKGLRTPTGGGTVAEEHSFTYLSDGSFFVVYRSTDGHPVCSYSRDLGKTWEEPKYMRFANGNLIKHPRAANFVWKCSNGKYLYWFHNHGGQGYDDRNPVWICAGEEIDSPEGRRIRWSEPEILLYDDDPYIRMSYPDYIEDDGKFYVTETQKDIARVHMINNDFINKLWNQFTYNSSCADDILLDEKLSTGRVKIKMPQLPSFTERDKSTPNFRAKDLRKGFTIEMWIKCHDNNNLTECNNGGNIIADATSVEKNGISICLFKDGSIGFYMNDGQTASICRSDTGRIVYGRNHHIAVIVDGGPGIISFVIDGVICDGGAEKQFGWGRFSKMMKDVNGADFITIDNTGVMYVNRLKIYGKALMVTDVIGNYRAGVRL